MATVTTYPDLGSGPILGTGGGSVQQLNWKDNVKAASTGNLTLSGTQTVDGIPLVAGDRILVKNQTSKPTNGIYVVQAGAWMRSPDADTAEKILAMQCVVEQGTANADTSWMLTTDSITLGTTDLDYVRTNVTTFLLLTDTPAAYAGSTNYLVRVNGTPDALEFLDPSTDFLSQYALLAGRAGGQAIIGGTAASENLTLASTSHGTKGDVQIVTGSDLDIVGGALLMAAGTVIDSSKNATFTTVNLTAATNQIVLDSDGTYTGTVTMAALGTASRTWTFPDKTGTVAMTSDIPTDISGESYIVVALSGNLSAERRLQGTTNQINLADGGANGDLTLSTPQDIHSGASPTFAALNLNAATNQIVLDADGTYTGTITMAALGTASRAWTLPDKTGTVAMTSDIPTDISGESYIVVALSGNLSAERRLQGTTNQINLVDGGANGDLTLSTPQDIHTAASPTFAALSLNAATNQIVLDADGTYTGTVTMAALGTASRTWTLPDKDGTVAMTSDIPGITGESFIVVALSGTLSGERRLQGTTNQINLADGGANGDLTLSTPQDIHTGASPTFVALSLNGATNQIVLDADGTYTGTVTMAALGTASRTWTLPDATGTVALTSDIPTDISGESYIVVALSGNLSAERRLQGTTNQINLADGGANGDLTLSTPQDIHTGASPTFAALNLNAATNQIVLDADGTYTGTITMAALGTASRTWTFPDKTGTVAMTSDIPGITGESFIVVALSGTLSGERRLQGTTNQINLADGGANGDLTLSTPQDIHSGASPTFSALNLNATTNQIVLDADGTYTGTITMAALGTASRTWTLPDVTGNIPVGTGATNRMAYWSAGQVLGGDATFTWDGTTLAIVNGAASAGTYACKVTGDTYQRLIINADGTMKWGPGNAAQDIALSRGAANRLDLASGDSLLVTQGDILVYGSAGSANTLRTAVTGDSTDRFHARADGRLEWGDGGVGGADTALERGAANRLDVNSGDSLNISSGDLQIAAGTVIDSSKNFTGLTLSLTAATNQIVLDSDGTYTGTVTMAALGTASRTWTLPDATGTVALTSDIPTDISGESYIVVALSGNLSAERRLQGTTNQINLADGGANGDLTLSCPQDIHTGASPTFAALNLNAATNQIVLDADGTYTGTITMAALGTASRTWTLPDKDGTVAMTSDIPGITGESFIVVSLSGTLSGERRLQGTTNQINLADGGANGDLTLSTPQDIHSGASPTFAALSLNAATNQIVLDADGTYTGTVTMAALGTASRTWTLPDATGTIALTSDIPTDISGESYIVVALSGNLSAERRLQGTANQISLNDGGANGDLTLSTPQDIHTGASPTFAGLVISGAGTIGMGGDVSFSRGAANRLDLATGDGFRIVNGYVEWTEQASVPGGAPAASYGKLWVKNDTPCTLQFTDDAGTDHDLTVGGGAPVGASYICVALDATLTAERRLQGTTNQISLNDGGANGDITLSCPQDIHSGASPTFAALNLNASTNQIVLDADGTYTGTVTMAAFGTASRTWTLPDATGTVALTSDIPTNISGESYIVVALSGNLSAERRLQGTANQISLNDGGANGDLTLSCPQDIHTGASPTFAGLVISTSGTIGMGGDVSFSRTAANVMSLASGDSLNLVSGTIQIASTTIFQTDRDVGIALLPDSDGGHDLGSTTQRWDQVFAKQVVYQRHVFTAGTFSIPNNADWTVNADAGSDADTNNNGLTVHLFDDTTEEGVGMEVFVPKDATQMKLTFVTRAETTPAGTRYAAFKIYHRGIPDNAAVEAWSAGTTLTDFEYGTNENFVYDTQTLTLSTESIETDKLYQIEATRVQPSGTEVTGDVAVVEIHVEFM